MSVEGFEPLLQFAYTSKLPFTKENIHAIHRSAEFLGFHNLESACFDFLIPKFSEGKKTPQEVRQRACCQSQDSSGGTGSSLQSSQTTSFESHRSLPSRVDERPDFASPCPQNAGQTNSRDDGLCLENCGPQMAPLSLELSVNEVCPMLSVPCPDKADHPSLFCERDILEMGGECSQSELTLAECGLRCELSAPGNVNPAELREPAGGGANPTVEMLGAETSCDPEPCPLIASGPGGCSELLEQREAGLQRRMTDGVSVPPLNVPEEALGERSSVEREVAEHMASILGFWSNLSPAQAPPLPLDNMEQNNLPKSPDFNCLKQLDLSSSVGDCPFLKGLEMGGDAGPHTDSLSQSEKSPYMSSSFNSGDDSDLDTDGDAEANSKRAAEVIVMHR